MLRRTRRAPNACSWCHHRKVRCDASILGSPCTRCRQDGRRECILRAKNPKPALSTTDQLPAAHQVPVSNDPSRVQIDSDSSRIHPLHTSQVHTRMDNRDCLTTNHPSQSPNALYTDYAFVDAQQLQSLPSEDITFLASKDCLSLPGPDALEEFIQQYLRRIHPTVPILDEVELWRIYRDNHPSGSKISLFVLQALLFASCPLVSLQTLRHCGFKDRRDAGKQLYNRAKLLFELKTEKRSHANAQGAVLLTHYTSADDPQAGSFWVTRAIEHATLIDAQPSLLVEHVSTSLKKRLWWSILLRDRSLSIGLRRHPQVTSINFHGWSDWLNTEDFHEELHASPVYDYDTKMRLLAALQKQCELAVLVTDLVSLAFTPRRTPRRYLSMTEFQGLMSRINTIKKSLDDWIKPSQPLGSPGTISPPKEADIVTTLGYMTYMFYYAARVDLAQYAGFVVEENLFYAGDSYSTLVLDISYDLRDGVEGLSLVMEHFSINGYADGLPLSVLGYLSMPLVLAAIDLKLSPSRKEMDRRQKRLKSLSQIIRHSEALYDVTDFVAIGTNHILQLAYATTQNLFLEEKKRQFSLPDSQAGEGSLSTSQSSGSAPYESISFKHGRPTSWQDAFVRCPRAYLLISTSVDYSLSIGRLPSASGLPEIVRDLPSIGVIERLPWTSEITSFDYGGDLVEHERERNHLSDRGDLSADGRDSVEIITTESESEQSPSQQPVQLNHTSSPEPFVHYPTIPPMMDDQVQYMHHVANQPYDNNAPNLDFMDFGSCQPISSYETETCAFTLPLECMDHELQAERPLDQTVLETYGSNFSQPMPQATKAIDSTLFDSFFHEAFEQHWAVS